MKRFELADLKYIPDEKIAPEMVPYWDDGWYEILKLAHSAHGVDHSVSGGEEAEIATKWKFESMKEARIALRFYVRARKYWSALEPTEEQKKRIVNALESIRRFAFEQTQEKSSRPLKDDNK